MFPRLHSDQHRIFTFKVFLSKWNRNLVKHGDNDEDDEDDDDDQGCRNCSILPSRMGEHGVSLENMGNMEKMENINQMTQKSPEDFWRRRASLHMHVDV